MMQNSTEIPSEIVGKWQDIVNLMAEIVQVPAATIMRVAPPNLRVFVASQSKGNPYHPNKVAPLNTGLYCEAVMSTRRPLSIRDALREEEWKSAPEIKVGLISYLGVPISWPDGEIFGTMCVLDNKANEYSNLYLRFLQQCRDVVQADLRWLTSLQGKVAEREAKIRRLVESNIIGIVLWDLDGRILEANEAFLRIVGYDRDAVALGRVQWTELTPPEWRHLDEVGLAELKRTGTLQSYEKEFFRKDGSRVSVLVGAASFEQSGDQGVAFILDLSERKRAEAKLYESERRYREMQRELAQATHQTTIGAMAASIAHEIRQPLTSISTSASAALRWVKASEPDLGEVEAALDRIVRDSHRVDEVISGVRSMFGNKPSEKSMIDVNSLIAEAIVLTQSELQEHMTTLQNNAPANVPPVFADRVQLQQVLVNLIVNAIDAMSPVVGRERILTIDVAIGGSVMTIAVGDTGDGVKQQNLDRIFEPFYTTKPDGMGLGLFICRSIVEAHGGKLLASRRVPFGTTFHISLISAAPKCMITRMRQRSIATDQASGLRFSNRWDWRCPFILRLHPQSSAVHVRSGSFSSDLRSQRHVGFAPESDKKSRLGVRFCEPDSTPRPADAYLKAIPLVLVCVRYCVVPARLVAPVAAAPKHSTVMKLSTLADVRDLVEKHLPEQYRGKPTWRHVSNEIAKAADGEKDLLEVCVALRLVLALEGGKCLMN